MIVEQHFYFGKKVEAFKPSDFYFLHSFSYIILIAMHGVAYEKMVPFIFEAQTSLDILVFLSEVLQPYMRPKVQPYFDTIGRWLGLFVSSNMITCCAFIFGIGAALCIAAQKSI